MGSYLGDYSCKWYFEDFQAASTEFCTQNDNENHKENATNYGKIFISKEDFIHFIRTVKNIYYDFGANRKQKIIRLAFAVISALKNMMQ